MMLGGLTPAHGRRLAHRRDTEIAANVPVVVVAFGYSATPVNELGADRVIGHFDELWDAVAALRTPAGSP